MPDEMEIDEKVNADNDLNELEYCACGGLLNSETEISNKVCKECS